MFRVLARTLRPCPQSQFNGFIARPFHASSALNARRSRGRRIAEDFIDLEDAEDLLDEEFIVPSIPRCARSEFFRIAQYTFLQNPFRN